jgi:hypothetical protein
MHRRAQGGVFREVTVLPPAMCAAAASGGLEDANGQAAQHAFDGCYFWSTIRGALQVLAFVANVWALAALSPANRVARNECDQRFPKRNKAMARDTLSVPQPVDKTP